MENINTKESKKGRPKKYHTDFEKREAMREQQRIYVGEKRERYKQVMGEMEIIYNKLKLIFGDEKETKQ